MKRCYSWTPCIQPTPFGRLAAGRRKTVPVAVEQSSGRDRLNIHGAIGLEIGQTVMKDVPAVDAMSTIMLLMVIEAMYPGMRLIHVFPDNARYHHAKLVRA